MPRHKTRNEYDKDNIYDCDYTNPKEKITRRGSNGGL
jgi:hypothetical protein